MKRQVVVIGLGQFGMSVANALSRRDVEVLAVDSDEARVRTASSFVAESACFDATDTDALGRIAPERRDVCLCSIGEISRENSIICTALLRQMGARRVVARANDDLHARILRLVGAHLVVNPERDFGERFASQILHEEIKGEMPLGPGVLITEAAPKKEFLGRSLKDLSLPRKHGVTVMAIRDVETGEVVLPSPERVLTEKDVLVMVARQGAVAKMMERA